MVDTRMDELVWLRNQLEAEGNDLLREMVRSFAQGLMSAEADVVCGAPWGQQSPDRVNRRNGYRTRRWDTRVGSIELRIPKLRRGSYFPEWLLDARTRSGTRRGVAGRRATRGRTGSWWRYLGVGR